jgi:hypothetical protein
VADLLRRRLRELGRSPGELAEAVEVPAEYIADLMSGGRRPPLPGRTDIYGKMTSFLRLGRNDVIACARAERAAAPAGSRGPAVSVRTAFLELCEPGTARTLARRHARDGGAELAGLIQRVLEVAQGTVRRDLDDHIGMRVAAVDRGRSYLDMRIRVLEFLDVTADAVTADDLTEFVRTRITRWDVDLETGVLRVVLRAERGRDRAPKRAAQKGVT